MATNLFARFRRMLPPSVTVIATVASVGSDGTSMVTLSGGGSMRVIGNDQAMGAKVYIKDGAILGAAPNLPHYELEV